MQSRLLHFLFLTMFCLLVSSLVPYNWWPIKIIFTGLGGYVIYYIFSSNAVSFRKYDFSSSTKNEAKNIVYQSLTGVLVDVSGSMKEAFSLDKTVSGNVERTHAIITTLNGIVKKESVAHNHRNDHVFASAFGLKDVKTCDLLELINYSGTDQGEFEGDYEGVNYYMLNQVRKDKEDPLYKNMTGHEVLIEFAKINWAPHAERWIRKSTLTEAEAGVLYTVLSRDEKLTEEFIEKLPDPLTTLALGITSSISSSFDVSDTSVQDSEVNKLAKKVIYRFTDISVFLQKPQVQKPKIWPVEEVSDLLDKILKKKNTSRGTSSELVYSGRRPVSFPYESPQRLQTVSSRESSAEVKDLFDYLTPFIFGVTPMFESLSHAKDIFYQNQSKTNKMVLFILSDGISTDGDPLPIAKDLRTLDVTVVTCFLTDDNIDMPKRLMDKNTFNSRVNEGATVLFEMSSSMHNTKAPVSYFVDAGWELPTSGESNLYFQANSLDLVDEFCNIVFSNMKNNTCADALVDIIAHISVADYINVVNSEFNPKEQSGNTCYANAIAAVYHLAMCRIVDRQGGVPSFETVLNEVTDSDRRIGGNTKFVLERTCSKYRLKFKEVDERDAREAVNKRHPVVARFEFNNRKQKREFGKFFEDNQRGILTSGDLTGSEGSSQLDTSQRVFGEYVTGTKQFEKFILPHLLNKSPRGYGHPIGHAVVLVRCEPYCLKFMNSWGQDWGDGGFFRVRNATVLPKMEFFDVYWDKNDLYPSEKEAFIRRGADEAKWISQTFSSLNELDYECPKCYCVSKVGDYTGTVLEAQCPFCRSLFKPDHEGVMQSLYISSRDFV